MDSIQRIFQHPQCNSRDRRLELPHDGACLHLLLLLFEVHITGTKRRVSRLRFPTELVIVLLVTFAFNATLWHPEQQRFCLAHYLVPRTLAQNAVFHGPACRRGFASTAALRRKCQWTLDLSAM